jgi:hypothetical protein
MHRARSHAPPPCNFTSPCPDGSCYTKPRGEPVTLPHARGSSLHAPSTCLHAAHPRRLHAMPPLPRRDVPHLVRMLAVDSRPRQQKQALETISEMCLDREPTFLAAIAAAGAIPAVVKLLGTGSSAEVHQYAAGALMDLSANTDIAATIAQAGAIPRLVQLGPAHALAQAEAAGALAGLAQNPDRAATIAAAGAIPLLVQMIGPGASADTQFNAAKMLGNLAVNAGSGLNIVAAGAIPALVN